MRQPIWTSDEVLLAVNTYFEIGDYRKISPDNPLVIELSQTLRDLPLHGHINETFRNLSGTEMTLKSIAKLDTNAKYSMKAFTNLQREIYNYYQNRQLFLRRLCYTMKACLPLPFEYRRDVSSPSNMTGNILYQNHLYIEQKSKTAKLVKANARGRLKSICQVCEKDLSQIYGENGPELLEQHYAEDITNYSKLMNVLQSRFINICPICHKLAHINPEMYLYNNLKQHVRQEGV